MLHISLRPSRYLAVLLAAAHAAAAVLVLTLDLNVAAKAALELFIAASAYYSAWRGALLRSGRSIVSFEIDRQGHLNVRSRLDDWQEATLLGTSFVSPALTILNLKIQNRWLARHVVILPDSLPSEDFRQLRVLLRWSKLAAGTGS
jgi:toxin CptA